MDRTNGLFSEKPSKIKKSKSNTIAASIKTAHRTLEIEAQTITNLKASLDADFEKSVTLIATSSGRIIVTGIGKSALVGRKLVATFNSTGTPAIFMHAADAIHGDLGMVLPTDIVLCISKSGETPEVKVLVPMLKLRASQLIAMVSHRQSYLAKQADMILYTPIEEEADPNRLAPTASTTAQMAMGDALAMALLTYRGFSSADFAQIHPGGILGKQLYLRVSDIYPQHECPRVQNTNSIQDTILEMTSKRLGCAAVLDEQKRLIGIITDGDLRRMLTQGNDIASLQAQHIMNTPPKTIDQNALAVQALELMREHSIMQLLVLDEDRYVGVVHLHDLLREGLV